MGSGPAAIIVEPDALAMADCLSADQRQERFDLIRYAVDTLTRNPAAAVYVDGWSLALGERRQDGRHAQRVGVSKARGFSLNTANFFTTDEEIGYGDAISGMTNGAHYVIEPRATGPGRPTGSLYWCNPTAAHSGTPPTTATASGNADAYLWVKRPGESDGSCGRGDPGAGSFMSRTPSSWPATRASRNARANTLLRSC